MERKEHDKDKRNQELLAGKRGCLKVAFSMALMAGCIKETIKQSLRGKGVNMTEGGETFQVESTSTLG